MEPSDIARLTITAWSLFALGALTLAWALFWDRSRGRRRCMNCLYDMKGVPGLTCPECGRTARSERRLTGTRRRWRWAAWGLLFCLAPYWADLGRAYHERGWASLVPSWVIVYFWPIDERAWFNGSSELSPVAYELNLRLRRTIPADDRRSIPFVNIYLAPAMSEYLRQAWARRVVAALNASRKDSDAVAWSHTVPLTWPLARGGPPREEDEFKPPWWGGNMDPLTVTHYSAWLSWHVLALATGERPVELDSRIWTRASKCVIHCEMRGVIIIEAPPAIRDQINEILIHFEALDMNQRHQFISGEMSLEDLMNP